MGTGAWNRGGREVTYITPKEKPGRRLVLQSHGEEGRRGSCCCPQSCLRHGRQPGGYLVVPGTQVLEASKASVEQAGQDGEQHHQEGEQSGGGRQTWEHRCSLEAGD